MSPRPEMHFSLAIEIIKYKINGGNLNFDVFGNEATIAAD